MKNASTITETDLRRLLDVVSPEACADQGAELPEAVLRNLAELIPCASISFVMMDTRRAETLAHQELALAEVPEDSDEDEALFFAAYWDCAACSYPETSGDHSRVTIWRDFYSEREFSKLLMAEYFRSTGMWHELLVTLPPNGALERRLLLSREAGDRPFTERDRLLLTLLRPHLVNLRERIEAERRTVPVLTTRQVQLLRRVSQGHTNRQIARDLGLAEGTVRKHLENIYARLEVNSRIEALARVPVQLIS